MGCCRASQVGEDKQLFDQLVELTKKLKSRPLDTIIMDMSVVTKKTAYMRFIEQAERINGLVK